MKIGQSAFGAIQRCTVRAPARSGLSILPRHPTALTSLHSRRYAEMGFNRQPLSQSLELDVARFDVDEARMQYAPDACGYGAPLARDDLALRYPWDSHLAARLSA